MKFQGKVLNWNDDKGFGFVEPNGGGERAFVHIKSFRSRTHRPSSGDVIIYKLVRDSNNRYRAENIEFAEKAKSSNIQSKSKNRSPIGTIFTLVFCIVLMVSVFIGGIHIIVAGIYLTMSLVAFIAYAFDKSAAQNGRWRTQESTLHAIALMGGWPGAFFAQNRLRHKSSKQEFKTVYKVTVLINLGGFIWLHTEKGASLHNGILNALMHGL